MGASRPHTRTFVSLLQDQSFSSIRVANPTICIGTVFAHNLRSRTHDIS
jgi:hypothetical protein